MRVQHVCEPNFFGIIVSANTVFSLQVVAVPLSGFHNTVASVLQNKICRLLSIIKSLVVPPTVSSCVFYSSIAEQYFAVSIFQQYFSNANVTIEGGAVGGIYYIYVFK